MWHLRIEIWIFFVFNTNLFLWGGKGWPLLKPAPLALVSIWSWGGLCTLLDKEILQQLSVKAKLLLLMVTCSIMEDNPLALFMRQNHEFSFSSISPYMLLNANHIYEGQVLRTSKLLYLEQWTDVNPKLNTVRSKKKQKKTLEACFGITFV